VLVLTWEEELMVGEVEKHEASAHT